MGDLDAKIGKQTSDTWTGVVGKGGLGEVNEAEERWLNFCLDHGLSLSNTEHAHHPRRLYTWTSPDGKTRNQIDYIAIEKKWKETIRNCKSYPGADCDTDHHLLVAKMKIKLKRQKGKTEEVKSRRIKWPEGRIIFFRG